MAEFNRTSLDIMDEIYAPFKEAQAQKRGLERQAGGAALSRQLQLTDAYTKRQQQLTDATTAQDRGLERITHQVEAQAQVGEDVAARLKKDKLVERREESAFLWNKLYKAGINPGFTISEINKATSGALAAMSAGMHLEVNTLTATKKSRTELIEKLKAFERTEAGRLALQEALGHADPIDWEAQGQESKAYLDGLFGDVTTKVNLQKLIGTVGYATHKRNKRIQMEALEDTGLMDFIMSQSQAGANDREEAAKWLAQLPGFEEQMLQSIKDDWTPGDQRPDKLRAFMAHLADGDLTAASAYLENEGEAGNQPLIEGITRWAALKASSAQIRLQAKILSKQGALQKLTSVNREINDYIGRHPEVEGQAIEDFYSNAEWDAMQGRMRAAQGDQPTSLEPGDPGLEGATLFSEQGQAQPAQQAQQGQGLVTTDALVEELGIGVEETATAEAEAVGQRMEAEAGYTPAQVAAAEEELRTPRFEGQSAAWSQQWGGTASYPGGLVGLGHIFGGKSAPISTNMFGAETSNVTDEAGATVPRATARLMAVRNRQVAENQAKGWSRNYEGKIEVPDTSSKSRMLSNVKAANLAFAALDAIDEKLKVIAGPERWKWLQGSFGVGAKTRTPLNLSRGGFNPPTPKTELSLDKYYD